MARRDVVATRLDKVERLLFEAAAEKAGVSKSQFLRATALTGVDALLEEHSKRTRRSGKTASTSDRSG